jgi:ketosteroid isomerase-like protein
VTLANPFGPVVRGWPEAAATMERAAPLYRDGEVVGFETMARHEATDFACIVENERYRARVGGRDAIASVALRATSIFRREDSAWKIVHRHADPITSVRPAESVLQSGSDPG